MSLTPQDIQKQKFNIKFRGFDVDEVDAFLEEVAEDFLALIQENKKLKERLEGLEQREAEYQNEEHTFKSAIIAAQKVADEMKEKARKETSELVTNAREEARALVAGAREEISRLQEEANGRLDNLKTEIEELEAMEDRVRDELRATLTRYQNYLEGGPRRGGEALETAPAAIATVAGQTVAETVSSPPAEAPESPEPLGGGAEEAAEAAAEAEAAASAGENGLDEAALAELSQDGALANLFQETAATESIEQTRTVPADEDEDFVDLFQRMEIPDAVDVDGDVEDTIEELTTDLLFSEEPSDDRKNWPAATQDDEESGPADKRQAQ